MKFLKGLLIFWIFAWCKIDLSLLTTKDKKPSENSKLENVPWNSPLIVFVSFSKMLLLFYFLWIVLLIVLSHTFCKQCVGINLLI